MANGDSGGAPDFLELAQAHHQATVTFIAAVAGSTPAAVEKALEVALQQAGELQTFLGWLADPAQTKDYPILGIRIHHPDGRAVQYLTPKMLPRLVGGRWVKWVNSKDGDLLTYSATMGLLTSIEARAIMMLQGYRIEFIQGRWPKDHGRSNGKRR
jgi:hypothetical protein